MTRPGNTFIQRHGVRPEDRLKGNRRSGRTRGYKARTRKFAAAWAHVVKKSRTVTVERVFEAFHMVDEAAYRRGYVAADTKWRRRVAGKASVSSGRQIPASVGPE